MTRQGFHTIDVARLEVAIKPSTPYNLVPNPDGALGAWGWVTPGNSYMRRRPDDPVPMLEHVASGTDTQFYTEPMPVQAGHYAAAHFTLPAIESAALTWQLDWLDANAAVVSSTPVSGTLTTAGNYSIAPTLAPAGTSFFRIRFNQASASTGRVTGLRAATATTAAALSTTRTNLVPNPSFEVNLNGWTPGPDTSAVRLADAAHVGGASMHLSGQAGIPGPQTVYASTVVAVEGELDYTFQARFRARVSGGFPGLMVQWLDGGGATLDASGQTHAAGTFDLFAVTHTAPPEATQARLTVRHQVPDGQYASGVYVDAVAFTAGTDTPTYWDGSTAATGTLTHAWTGAAHESPSTRTDTTLASLAATEWRNILGPTHSIKTARESLNVGTLEAELLDANLDPATSSTLRPGGAVRLLALVASVWEPVFVGEIDRLTVQYDDKRRPIRPPRVHLTAVDMTRRLAGARRTQGVAEVADLAHVLEGAGVPWDVNGSTAQLASAPAVVSLNDNATALDQIALTRDSKAAHAWVDRRGVLVATTAAAGAAVRTLDEPRYSDLEVAFSTEACINAVEVEALTLVPDSTPTGGAFMRTDSIMYGPYEDAVSIARWGRRLRKFTVHGLNASQASALGAAILARNANPGVTVQSVTLPMRTSADLADLLRDLGEIVKVTNTARGISPDLRVTSVEHTIESVPAKWLVRLGFTTAGSVAAPTIAPEVQQAGANARLVGEIKMWPTNTAPPGFLLCNGATFSSTTYPDLAAVLGDTFGASSGTTYYLPDFRGRSPLGTGTQSPLQVAGWGIGLGQKYGHVSMAAHGHAYDELAFDYWAAPGSGPPVAGHTGARETRYVAAEGGGDSGNVHPILGVNFIIRT